MLQGAHEHAGAGLHASVRWGQWIKDICSALFAGLHKDLMEYVGKAHLLDEKMSQDDADKLCNHDVYTSATPPKLITAVRLSAHNFSPKQLQVCLHTLLLVIAPPYGLSIISDC